MKIYNRMKYIFLTVLFLIALSLGAQTIENVKATFQDNQVTVTYDLVHTSPNTRFVVELFSSHNSFKSPVNLAHGDIGKGVTAGKQKHITWRVAEEVGAYEGSISFIVRGNFGLAFTFPTEKVTIRRGKATVIRWVGGSSAFAPKVSLFKSGEPLFDLPAIETAGEINWAVPVNIEKGSDYSLTLTQGGEKISSGLFTIQPKYPLWMKGVAAVGGAVGLYFIIDAIIGDGVESNAIGDAPKGPDGN